MAFALNDTQKHDVPLKKEIKLFIICTSIDLMNESETLRGFF